MNLIYVEDYEEMSEIASQIMLDDSINKEDWSVCLATGSSPLLAYELFVNKVKEANTRTNDWKMVQLDEWVGVDNDSMASCEHFLNQNIIKPLNLEKQFIHWNSLEDPQLEVNRMKEYLDDNPLNLCILGLGKNGHLGLNEPSEYLITEPHVCELSQKSKTHSMLERETKPINYGMTIGMKHILNAKHILFLVTGKEKLEAFEQFMTKEISCHCPASFLWLHAYVDCIVCKNEF